MLSNNQQKLIRSLQQKKYRDINGMFVLEGEKILSDLLSNEELNTDNTVLLTGTESWIGNNENLIAESGITILPVGQDILKKVSSFNTPPRVLAVVKKPDPPEIEIDVTKDHILMFNAIRDPGNLGTIIRSADWFGFRKLVCSNDSVDAYNNKVIQSSMGAIIRLQPVYANLKDILGNPKHQNIPIYGTTMKGISIYEKEIIKTGIILFGNESSGIDAELESYITDHIAIPDFPTGCSGSESLNIASSVAVICSELRRRMTPSK